MEDLVVIEGLSKSYDSRFNAINNISIRLPKGKVIGLLGPNGSGKTTLIKILNGLLQPGAGTVAINGLPVGVETKRMISYLPDRTYLNESQKIKDVLGMFQDFYPDFRVERARMLLEKLGIDENVRMKTLSKGNKEKVQLILVMSRDADIYILDEPIAGVDPAARDYILRTIIENHNPNATVLVSTHLIRDVEEVLDEVIFMHSGQLVLYTSVEQVRQKHNKSVDEYFREVFAC